MTTSSQVSKSNKKKPVDKKVKVKGAKGEVKSKPKKKYSACHARNALYEVKNYIVPGTTQTITAHFNDDAMRLIADGMKDYQERLVTKALEVGDKRDSHKNLVTAADIIKASQVTLQIFPKYLLKNYKEPEKVPRSKSKKATSSGEEDKPKKKKKVTHAAEPTEQEEEEEVAQEENGSAEAEE